MSRIYYCVNLKTSPECNELLSSATVSTVLLTAHVYWFHLINVILVFSILHLSMKWLCYKI